MTIQRYEIFNMTVQLGNITRASEALNMTQSGVSHALKSLEDEFDVKLLHRHKNGLNLTSQGAIVYEHTLRVIYENNILLEEISNLKGVEKGRIRVGSFASVTTQWIPKILNYFNEYYPNISIEIYEDDYESLEKMVSSGELDCCFTSQFYGQDLNFNPLVKDTLYCIVSTDNELAKHEFITIDQIENLPLIKPKKGWDSEVSTLFNRFQIKPYTKYEVSDDQAILALVEANIGLNIRPGLVVNKASDKIKALPFDEEAYRIIGIATNDWVSPVVTLFVNTVTDMFQENVLMH